MSDKCITYFSFWTKSRSKLYWFSQFFNLRYIGSPKLLKNQYSDQRWQPYLGGRETLIMLGSMGPDLKAQFCKTVFNQLFYYPLICCFQTGSMYSFWVAGVLRVTRSKVKLKYRTFLQWATKGAYSLWTSLVTFLFSFLKSFLLFQ